MKDILKFVSEYNGCENYDKEMLSYIFCEMAYFDFSKFNNIGIRKHMLPVSALKGINIGRSNIEKKFWDAFAKNDEFSQAKIGHYQEILNTKKGIQFAAVTVEYKGINFICYRGTDINISGWKEDIDLGYEDVIPSQIAGIRYLNRVATKISGEMIVSGHSKGGNVAVYSCANTSDKIRDRVLRIYSFDGVGFRQSFYRSSEYAKIRDKVVKFVPRHSVVGLLFGNDRNTTLKVIDADGIGFNQHTLENWKVEEGAFILQKRVADFYRTLAKNMNIWIFNLKKPEARKLINTIYGIAYECGISDKTDVSKRFVVFSTRTLKRYFASQGNSRKECNKIVGDFLGAVVAW